VRLQRQSPLVHVKANKRDEDTALPQLLIDELARATPTASRALANWRERIYAGEVGLSMFGLQQQVADPIGFVLSCVLGFHGLVDTMGIGHARIQAFSSALNQGYNPAIPFHNGTHAADVLYCSHMLLVQSGMTIGGQKNKEKETGTVEDAVLEAGSVLALLISAAVHDFKHPGVTNAFLVNTNDALAIMYNDKSVLENYHVAEAFKLMQSPAHNLLHALDAKQYREIRSQVVRMVLATDMAEHFQHVTELVSTASKAKKLEGEHTIPPSSPFARLRFSHSHSSTDPHISTDRLLAILLHTADISHPFRGVEAHVEWSQRLRDEFFAQGDLEKKRNMPISPMCDRGQAAKNFAAGQIGFIDAVVQLSGRSPVDPRRVRS